MFLFEPGVELWLFNERRSATACGIYLQSTGTTSANAIEMGRGCAYIGIIVFSSRPESDHSAITELHGWRSTGWAARTHGQGFLNGTWEYNVTAGQWTWWKGSSDVNQGGQYLQHVSFVGNVPGARRGTSLWQPDFLDYIWIFGGQGYDANPATGNGYLADLWTYLPYP